MTRNSRTVLYIMYSCTDRHCIVAVLANQTCDHSFNRKFNLYKNSQNYHSENKETSILITTVKQANINLFL